MDKNFAEKLFKMENELVNLPPYHDAWMAKKEEVKQYKHTQIASLRRDGETWNFCKIHGVTADGVDFKNSIDCRRNCKECEGKAQLNIEKYKTLNYQYSTRPKFFDYPNLCYPDTLDYDMAYNIFNYLYPQYDYCIEKIFQIKKHGSKVLDYCKQLYLINRMDDMCRMILTKKEYEWTFSHWIDGFYFSDILIKFFEFFKTKVKDDVVNKGKILKATTLAELYKQYKKKIA